MEGIWHLITFKGTLSTYIVGTTAVGYYMAPGEVSKKTWALTLGGTALTVLSANAWNQIFEAESDRKMQRTAGRYLPLGGCPNTAIVFAATTGIAGGYILWKYVHPLPAKMAVINIGLYACIYTPMKRMHWFNTWVGGVVGAIPPMIGWAAKTGGTEMGSWVLGGLLFFWQMPHFMAIAWKNQDDYEKGGYQMLVNTDREAVAGVAFRYSLPLLLIGPLSYYSGMTSQWFMATSLVPTVYAVASAYPFYEQPTVLTARQLFFSSLKTLPVIMGLLLVHRVADPSMSQRVLSRLEGVAHSLAPSLCQSVSSGLRALSNFVSE